MFNWTVIVALAAGALALLSGGGQAMENRGRGDTPTIVPPCPPTPPSMSQGPTQPQE